MIRVLCVFSNLDRGGAETMCMNLYRKIDRTKIQFDFVKHTTKKCAFEEEIEKLGGKIFIAPRFKYFNYISYCDWWKSHFKNHPEHQIIHGHFFTISSIYFKVANKFNRVTIGHSHIASSGLESSFSIKKFLKVILRMKVKNTADFRLACSNVAGEFLYKKKDYLVLKNAIDTEAFVYNADVRNRKREELNISSEHTVFCLVGRIEEQKNPEGAVEIFKKIHLNDVNARFLWVGDGTQRSSLDNRIKSLNLENEIRVLGVRNDVADIMQAVDVFILPSIYEGLPVVAIEAQASGLPCLLGEGISKETAITDLCRFIPIDKPELWAKAASELDLSKRRNTKSEIVNAGYDIDKTAKWLENLYISIIEKRNSNNGQ